MPNYRVLIDDGEMISCDAHTTFLSIDLACRELARTAMIIAADHFDLTSTEQILTCEVQENNSGPKREFDVIVSVVRRL